jgi:nucleotide-binding universal stress UspA family protein
VFDKILACLDGSAIAEKILPLAQGIASRKGRKVILLRVVGDSKELLTEESYMRLVGRLFPGGHSGFLSHPIQPSQSSRI